VRRWKGGGRRRAVPIRVVLRGDGRGRRSCPLLSEKKSNKVTVPPGQTFATSLYRPGQVPFSGVGGPGAAFPCAVRDRSTPRSGRMGPVRDCLPGADGGAVFRRPPRPGSRAPAPSQGGRPKQ